MRSGNLYLTTIVMMAIVIGPRAFGSEAKSRSPANTSQLICTYDGKNPGFAPDSLMAKNPEVRTLLVDEDEDEDLLKVDGFKAKAVAEDKFTWKDAKNAVRTLWYFPTTRKMARFDLSKIGFYNFDCK